MRGLQWSLHFTLTPANICEREREDPLYFPFVLLSHICGSKRELFLRWFSAFLPPCILLFVFEIALQLSINTYIKNTLFWRINMTSSSAPAHILSLSVKHRQQHFLLAAHYTNHAEAKEMLMESPAANTNHNASDCFEHQKAIRLLAIWSFVKGAFSFQHDQVLAQGMYCKHMHFNLILLVEVKNNFPIQMKILVHFSFFSYRRYWSGELASSYFFPVHAWVLLEHCTVKMSALNSELSDFSDLSASRITQFKILGLRPRLLILWGRWKPMGRKPSRC